MGHSILFVDDEPAVLSGIERLIGLHHNVHTASSGSEALEVIAKQGPFELVFTDMRMPTMNGLEFVDQARQLAPHSVYLMLTGNLDQETAVSALNSGRISHFMNKPCSGDALKAAITEASKQYDSLHAEKGLLRKTFVGAVQAVTKVAEVCHADFNGRSEKIEEKLDTLREALSIDDRWEFRLSARLSLVGFALLPEAELLDFENGDHASPQAIESIKRAAEITSRLISDIPRLDMIGKIFGHTEELNGAVCSTRPRKPGAVIQVGATLLRVALHWDFLARQGLSSNQLGQEIKKLLPEINPMMLDAILETTEEIGEGEAVLFDVEELEPGMVTASDVCDGGALLLRKGQRLTAASIEKLGSQSDPPRVQVTNLTAKIQPALTPVEHEA